MATDPVDALVIFGATGDLAKLETFPALVGLVERGALDVPVVGVAKSGWGLEQFRDYAVASLKLNGMDPAAPAATGDDALACKVIENELPALLVVLIKYDVSERNFAQFHEQYLIAVRQNACPLQVRHHALL